MWKITKRGTGDLLSLLATIQELVDVLKAKAVWGDEWRESSGDKKEIFHVQSSLCRYYELTVKKFETNDNPYIVLTGQTFKKQFATFLGELEKFTSNSQSIDKKVKFIQYFTEIRDVVKVTLQQVEFRGRKKKIVLPIDVDQREKKAKFP